MTYKEAIQQSLKTIYFPPDPDLEAACFEAGLKEDPSVRAGVHVLPIPFTTYLMSTAALLGVIAQQSLSNAGQAQAVTSQQVIHILSGADLKRHTPLFQQFHHFLQWLLPQEVPENEDDISDWCETSVLAEKWNEYVAENQADAE